VCACWVAVAALTERIRNVTEHMRAHHKDVHTRRGLDRMLHRRRRLMWYLRRADYARYVQTIRALGLADVPPSLNERVM
jgi:small subunit ribosomal protein S15